MNLKEDSRLQDTQVEGKVNCLFTKDWANLIIPWPNVQGADNRWDYIQGIFTPRGLHLQFHGIDTHINTYLKICAPFNFPPQIFAHPQSPGPFNFCPPLFYCKFAVFPFIRVIFPLPLIFAQARCAKIKGARILMGIRYYFAWYDSFGIGNMQ